MVPARSSTVGSSKIRVRKTSSPRVSRSLDTSWWVAVEPGILLFVTVLAFNFFGDGLRDAFDPRSLL